MQPKRLEVASAGDPGAGHFSMRVVATKKPRKRVIATLKTAIPWSQSKFWCGGCQRPLRYEHLSQNGVWCRECFEKLEQSRMSEALSRLPDMLEHLRPEIRAKVDSGPVVSKLLESLGGDYLGHVYAQKLKDVLDSPSAGFREVRQWLNGAMKLIQRQEQLDRAKEAPVSGMSNEELRDRLRPLAIELMRTDPTFYSDVMAACHNVIPSTATEIKDQPTPSVPPAAPLSDDDEWDQINAELGHEFVGSETERDLSERAEVATSR